MLSPRSLSLSLSRCSHRRPPRVLRDPASVDEDAHDGDSESQHRQQCRSHGLQNDPVGDVLPRRFHDHGTGHHSERATDRDDGGERSDEQELRPVLRDRWKQSQAPDCDPSRGNAAAAVARVFHEPVEDRSLLRGWAPISRLHRAWRASRPPELSSSLRSNLEGFQGATECPSESQHLALSLTLLRSSAPLASAFRSGWADRGPGGAPPSCRAARSSSPGNARSMLDGKAPSWKSWKSWNGIDLFFR